MRCPTSSWARCSRCCWPAPRGLPAPPPERAGRRLTIGRGPTSFNSRHSCAGRDRPAGEETRPHMTARFPPNARWTESVVQRRARTAPPRPARPRSRMPALARRSALVASVVALLVLGSLAEEAGAQGPAQEGLGAVEGSSSASAATPAGGLSDEELSESGEDAEDAEGAATAPGVEDVSGVALAAGRAGAG